MGFKRSLLSKKSDQFREHSCLVCDLVSAVKPLDGLFLIRYMRVSLKVVTDFNFL